MFDRVYKQFDIDIEKTYMVGDRAGDISMGQRAGMTTVLVEPEYGTARLEQDIVPDYICKDLRNVVELL